MKKLAVAVVAAALATFTHSKPASALGPIDLEIGAKVGTASSPSTTGLGASLYGFGVGGRAGVSFIGFYGGLSGMYYFGTSSNGGDAVHTGMYGLEAGYTISLGFIKFRPQVGVGNATFSATGVTSVSNLYIEPGVLAMIPIGSMFIGADVNALILPGVSDASVDNASTTYTSLSIHGQVGVTF